MPSLGPKGNEVSEIKTISQVIEELASIKRAVGDLPVYMSKDDEGNAITEYYDYDVTYEDDEVTPLAVILYRGWEPLPGTE